MKIKTERYVDKSNWETGPWMYEPDKIQWIDPETDLDCLIVRGPFGALCGYVGVPPGHPLYGKEYTELDVNVHGGLTFSAPCDEGGNICHVPEPGRSGDIWWLGFDCAHYCDLSPGMDFRFGRLGGSYKDVQYVTGECESLALQLRRAA